MRYVGSKLKIKRLNIKLERHDLENEKEKLMIELGGRK